MGPTLWGLSSMAVRGSANPSCVPGVHNQNNPRLTQFFLRMTKDGETMTASAENENFAGDYPIAKSGKSIRKFGEKHDLIFGHKSLPADRWAKAVQGNRRKYGQAPSYRRFFVHLFSL